MDYGRDCLYSLVLSFSIYLSSLGTKLHYA